MPPHTRSGSARPGEAPRVERAPHADEKRDAQLVLYEFLSLLVRVALVTRCRQHCESLITVESKGS